MSSRVPISFYLNILAGIIVLFNHYATSETGDLALNKVTGAAGRFRTVFRDTALKFQHGCSSHLETAFCGPTVNSIFPRDAAEYIRLRYCHGSAQDSGSVSMGGMPSDRRRPHGGYGGPDVALVYYQPHMGLLEPYTSEDGLFGSSPFVFDWLKQRRFSQETWRRCYKMMEATGALSFHISASWWWFRLPARVTGVLLAAYAAMSTIEYLFETNEVVRSISQVYMVVMVDFLRCIEWEARRHILDIAASMMEGAYDTVMRTCKRV